MIFTWKPRNKKSILSEKEKLPKDKFLDMKVNSDNWRKIAFSSILVSLFSIFGVVQLSFNNKIQTYIIEKNGNNYEVLGEIKSIASEKKIISDDQVIYFIFNFIVKTKFLTPNLKLYKKNYQEVLSFMTPSSSAKLDRYLIENGYREKIEKKQTVEIIENTGIKLDNNSYQIRWTEKTSDTQGKVVDTENFMGIFTIKFVEIKEKGSLIYNPLSMVIVDFTQTKEKL